MRALFRSRGVSVATSFAIVTCTTLFANTAMANDLDAADLKSLVAGKTIYLSAPFGSVPIRYNASGTMVAKSRAMGVYAGISKDKGSWRIADNRLCQRWNVWNKGREQCFRVKRAGSTLKWTSDDGMTGTAVAAN